MINAVGRSIPDYLLANGREVYQGKGYRDGQKVKKASPTSVKHGNPRQISWQPASAKPARSAAHMTA